MNTISLTAKVNVFLTVISLFFLTSCSVFLPYSEADKKLNNSFTIYSNVPGAQISPLHNSKKESFTSTNNLYSSGEYYTENTFSQLKKRRTKLVISKTNYISDTIVIKRSPRAGILAIDIICFPYLPFDLLSHRFYKISKKTKEFHISLDFTNDYMKKEFEKIKKTKEKSLIDDYIKKFQNSTYVSTLQQRKDSIISLENKLVLEKNEVIGSKDLQRLIDFKTNRLIQSDCVELINEQTETEIISEVSGQICQIVKAKTMSELTNIVGKGEIIALVTLKSNFNSNKSYREHLTKTELVSISSEISTKIAELVRSEIDTQFKIIKKKKETLLLIDFNKKLYADSIWREFLPQNAKDYFSLEISKLLDKEMLSTFQLNGTIDKQIEICKDFWLNVMSVEANNKNIVLSNCRSTRGDICDVILTKLSTLNNEKEQEQLYSNVSQSFGTSFTGDYYNLLQYLVDNCKKFDGNISTFGTTLALLQYKSLVDDYYLSLDKQLSNRQKVDFNDWQSELLKSKREELKFEKGNLVSIEGHDELGKVFGFKRFFCDNCRKSQGIDNNYEQGSLLSERKETVRLLTSGMNMNKPVFLLQLFRKTDDPFKGKQLEVPKIIFYNFKLEKDLVGRDYFYGSEIEPCVVTYALGLEYEKNEWDSRMSAIEKKIQRTSNIKDLRKDLETMKVFIGYTSIFSFEKDLMNVISGQYEKRNHPYENFILQNAPGSSSNDLYLYDKSHEISLKIENRIFELEAQERRAQEALDKKLEDVENLARFCYTNDLTGRDYELSLNSESLVVEYKEIEQGFVRRTLEGDYDVRYRGAGGMEEIVIHFQGGDRTFLIRKYGSGGIQDIVDSDNQVWNYCR